MRHFWRLGLRNLLRQRVRTLITLAAIMFGTAGLVLSGGFVRDVLVQLGEALIHSQSGHLQVGQEAAFSHGSRSPEQHLLVDELGTLRTSIAAQPGVADVMSRITFSGLLNNGKADYAVIGDGVEADAEQRLGRHLQIVSGRPLDGNDVFGAMLGEGVARALKLGPGDAATLVVSTIDGSMNTIDIEVVGVFQSFSKDFDARAIRIPLAAAQELLMTDGVSKFVVVLKDTRQTDAFVENLRTLLPVSLGVRDWRQLNDFYQKTVDLYRQQFGFLKIMVLLMVCLSVVNTVSMALMERMWEFGTMRALGNTNRAVAGLILVETVTLGLIGASLGLVAGVALATAISGIGIPMPPPPNSDLGYDAFIRIVPEVLIETWVIGVLATVFAGLHPAWRFSRVSIIDALGKRE